MAKQDSTYVPVMGDVVEVRVTDGDNWTEAVVEDYRSCFGWCVYLPQAKRKHIVPASAMRPATFTDPQSGELRRRKSLVSGPFSWTQQASLMVERAKSSRARCEGCRKEIAKSGLRVGMKKAVKRSRYYSRKEWFHPSCLEAGRCTVSSINSFAGHDGLDEGEKEELARLVAKLASPNHRGETRVLATRPNGLDQKAMPSVGDEEQRAKLRNQARENFARACRIVVAQFVQEFKKKAFEVEGRLAALKDPPQEAVATGGEGRRGGEGGKVLTCPVTGREMRWADSHVHHDEPSFDRIVRSFAERQLNANGLNSVRYHLGSFVDQRLAHAFHEYHAERCRLRVVHKEANMGILKRKRVTTEGEEEKAEEDTDEVREEERIKERRKRRKEAKDAMYAEILGRVRNDDGWQDQGKAEQWKVKLGDMWARLKRERNFKCGRVKRKVGGILLQLLHKKRK